MATNIFLLDTYCLFHKYIPLFDVQKHKITVENYETGCNIFWYIFVGRRWRLWHPEDEGEVSEGVIHNLKKMVRTLKGPDTYKLQIKWKLPSVYSLTHWSVRIMLLYPVWSLSPGSGLVNIVLRFSGKKSAPGVS